MIKIDKLFIHGRYSFDNVLHIYNTASGIEFNAVVKKITIAFRVIPNQQPNAWLRAIIDNKTFIEIKTKEETFSQVLSFDKEEVHNIKILKVSEAIESYVDIDDIDLDGYYLDKPKYDKTFLVLGDSTVSAYGLLGKNGEDKTLFDTDGLKGFAYLTSKAFDASMNSLNGSGWGLCFSPWTTPQRRPLLGIYDRVAPLSLTFYDVKQINPKVIIISLGTNDSYYFTLNSESKTKEELINEFKNDFHKLLVRLKEDFGSIPIFMVYGAMREAHNYAVMHDIFLENKKQFNIHEVKLEGDGNGVSGHPSLSSHESMSKVLIAKIKGVINE